MCPAGTGTYPHLSPGLPQHNCPTLSKWRHQPNTEKSLRFAKVLHRLAIADLTTRWDVSYTSGDQKPQNRYPLKPPACAVVNSCMPFSMARQGHEPRFPKLYTRAFPAKPVIRILFASCLACSTPCCTYAYNGYV